MKHVWYSTIGGYRVSVALPLPQTNDVPPLKLGISYKQTELHLSLDLSPLARVCGSSFPQDFLLAVKHLDIIWNLWGSDDSEVIENSEWLELYVPRKQYHESRPPCKNSSGKEFCPPWRLLPYISQRRGLSKKVLRGLFLHDNLPVTPLPFLTSRDIMDYISRETYWASVGITTVIRWFED